MKVLFVVPDYSGNGGAETVIKTTATALNKSGINTFIYIAAKRKKPKKTYNTNWLDGLTHKREHSLTSIEPLIVLHHAFKISRIIKRYKFTKIIFINGRNARILRTIRWFSHSFPPTYSWAHISIPKVKQLTNIFSADYHLAISNGIAQQLKDYGADKEKIFTIFNPVIEQKDVIKFSTENLIFIGRLRESHKRVSDIITAISRIDGVTLHIIGDGDSSDLYKDRVKKESLSHKIIFHGYQKAPWDFISNNINGVGALLLSSNREGFPMVLCEAMSRGIYCISSNCETGPRDIIVPGVNGDLFPVGDTDDLTNKITKLLNNEIIPNQKTIIDSISHIYTENYIKKLIKILEST